MLSQLSIIILAKNEAENLISLIPKLKKLSNDVLLIDGHSADNTKNICKKNNIRFYLDNNIGKGDAQRLGVSKAKNKNIIFIDGDGAHDVNDIKIINNLLQNKDLVICSRQTGGSYDLNFNQGFSSAIRAAGVIFLVVLFNKLFNTNFTDILYSLKGISKSNFKKIKTSENGFTIEIDILINSIINKLLITEIPSREYRRKYGVSKLPTITGLYFIYFIIKKYLFYKITK
jgi:cellulose synthase/poly-beta-1,6-N-acetylglucosamine synthase-like glycosyltransferase